MQENRLPKFLDWAGRQGWLKAALLAVVTLLVYVPAIRGGFIWDDELFVENPLLKSGFGGLWTLWFAPPTPDYFPLTSTSFWIEKLFFGSDPMGYHLDNVLLHIGVAMLLWRVLLRLRVPGAWLGALIFAVHPVNVASVAWIAERKNTLSGLFFLGTILAWLEFVERGKWKYYVGALFLFLLALLSKTSAVMLPVSLPFFIWWVRKKITWQDGIAVVPFFVLSLVLGLVTMHFQQNERPGLDLGPPETFWMHLAGVGWIIWFYLGKALWPANLMMIYPRWEIDGTALASYLPDVALVIAAIVLWRYRKSWGGPLLLALSYFGMMFFPVMGFIFMNFRQSSLVSDHYQYLPLMGLCGLFGTGLFLAGRSVSRMAQGRIGLRPLVYAGACGLIVVLSLLTAQRAEVFGDELRLWSENVQKNPGSWGPLGNLGAALAKRGRHEEAIGYYLRALKVKPTLYQMQNCLGQSYFKLGRIGEALGHYAEALRLYPLCYEAHNNMGVALMAGGFYPEAIAHYKKAMETDPYHLLGASNCGQALIETGRAPEAALLLRETLQRYPEDAELDATLGLAMAMQGNTREAIDCYLRALRIDPNNTRTRNNLGGALVQENRLTDAEQEFRVALKIAPQDVDVRNNLALVLLKENRPAEAIREYRAVIQLNPFDPSSYNALARVLATNRNSSCRNGAEAVKLAEMACQMTEHKNPRVLDTAAAAYAEAGQFEKAVKLERDARKQAATGEPGQIAEMDQRLKVYEAGKPLRE